MIALIWLLAWLPQVLPAKDDLPQPANLTLNSAHFRTMLKWEPGPSTPTGVYYEVTFNTDKGTSWVLVPGCEHVQHPLVCNMTDVFTDPNMRYLAKVTCCNLQGAQKSQPAPYPTDFNLIKDSQLELPLLTVTSCDTNLCVDLQFPKSYKSHMSQHHRDLYNSSLTYKLKINNHISQEIRYLQKHIVKPVVLGRQYCISVCFWDRLESMECNYSQPVCVSTPGIFSADPWISSLLCLLVILGVVIVALLVYAGFICPFKRPLPLILTSVPHIEDVLVITGSNMALSSVLTVKTKLPSSGERVHKQSSSDESDEEREMETTGRYKLHVGASLLSSSFLSSSSLSPPLYPKPEPQSLSSSNQTSDSPQTCSFSAMTNTLSTHAGTDREAVGTTEHNEEEKEVVEEACSRDVNLLTLTFGRHDVEEEQESHLHVVEVKPETPSVSEEYNITSIQPSKPGYTREEDDEEEEEGESAYLGRPSTAVLQTLLTKREFQTILKKEDAT